MFEARNAKRYPEVICLAQKSIDNADQVLVGASHFESAQAWEGLGCHEEAVKAIEASLAKRPVGRSGWKETCDLCEQLRAACDACDKAVPSIRDTDWKAMYRPEAGEKFELGPPSVMEVIYGDIFDDDSEEAVVWVSDPDTKSQNLNIYAMRNGKVVRIDEIDGGWRTDGGVIGVSIRDKYIYVDRSQLAEDDPMGSPSLESSERWSWVGSALKEDASFRKTRMAK